MFFIKNDLVISALILTCANFLCRAIGFLYRIFISQTYGAEAIGVIQLVSPILSFAYAICCAGFQTAISRIAASKKQTTATPLPTLLTGSALSFLLSALLSLVLYIHADEIAVTMLFEKRTAPLLRILCLSFPFSSIHSCINGYFYGINRSKVPAFLQLVEQLIRVSSVFFLCQWFLYNQSTPPLVITAIGTALSEFFISILVLIVIFAQKSKIQTSFEKKELLLVAKPLCAMVIPLSLSRIIITFLQSIENIYIPKMLQTYGYHPSKALAEFGTLTGMTFSVIFLPCSFVNSIALLLLPKVAASQSQGQSTEIAKTIKKTLQFCLLFGTVFLLIFLIFGKRIGLLLFHNQKAGEYIRALSLICPFLYITSALGAVLHGLGKNYTTLLINVIALSIRIAFIFFAIPHIGMSGYILGLLVSQVFLAISCICILKKIP